jgi:UDP-GlcNAc:undecaprenyl-phosphate/decaprenyl-phosphate GlcNAc-1-phosphate transferase
VKDYVLTLLVAAAVTYILTPLVRRLAGRIGAMKQPRDRDVHVVPVPTIGGLAMYGGLAAGLLVADHISVLRIGLANTGMITGLLLAGGLLLVIGFIDDRWGMDALPKAAGQVAAGGILVATGTSLSWLPLPGGNTYVPTTDQATLLTILVVVATINAVNFIDGLDGLAAGIVCIAAVSFFLYYYVLTKVTGIDSLAAPALASAILIGMCIGFLPHNFSPATIFMGDTGSMLLGLLLAYAPISSITSVPQANLTSQINRYPVVLPLLLPAALLVIPYGDMLLAVVRRTRAGRSPFAPDRKHLHHRLLDIGHSQRTSVLIMYLWAAAFSGTVVWLSIQKTVQHGNSNHHGAPIFVFVIITALAFAVLLLLSMPRLRWWQRSRLAPSADARATGSGAAAGAGMAGAGAARGGGAGPVLETTVLETTVLETTVLESPVRESPVLGAPVVESTVLETTGPGGSRRTGMTSGPTLPRTGPAGQAPGHRGLLGRASAERGAGIPPFAAAPHNGPPPVAGAPLATQPIATQPLAAPPSTANGGPPTAVLPAGVPPVAGPPSVIPPLEGPPSVTPSVGVPPVAGPPSVTPPLAGPASVTPPLAGPPSGISAPATPPAASPFAGSASPGSPVDRSLWRAGQATPNGTETARSLAFWRNPATGLPPTGLPAARRSVTGTPPPAVAGPQGLGGGMHRASAWLPEILPPAAADGSKAEPDGLA